MIFGPIACFRRPESRFSGQNGPRSSEMMFYVEITGYIKNHQNFKILFWSRESEKMIFTIFPEKIMKKWAGNTESRVRRRLRESRVRRRFRESRVRRRKPGLVITDFPFYGFLRRLIGTFSRVRRPCNREWDSGWPGCRSRFMSCIYGIPKWWNWAT